MLILLASFALVGFFVAQPVQAQVTVGEESCICWCQAEFAFPIEGYKNSAIECSRACAENTFNVHTSTGTEQTSAVYLGCYTASQEGLMPNNDTRCWTQSECEQDQIEINGEWKNSRWGGSNPLCISGEGFCYNATEPVTLGVAIAEVTEAGTIGEYVAALYRWLIPAGAMLAIMMIMIGGLQYALARGNPTAIGAAKERMANAVIGLVLLLAAYTIAGLIDPALVLFKNPQPPKIRQVTFIDPDSTCDYLENEGFTIQLKDSSQEKECGVVGLVESIPEGQESTIEEGHECIYDACDWPERCVASPEQESGYACQRCSDSYTGGSGVSPSPANCSQLNADATRPNDKNHIYPYCEYRPALEIEALSLTLAAGCFELVYPETVEASGVDCNLLRSDSYASPQTGATASCRSYDFVQARWGSLSGTQFNEADDVLVDDGLLDVVCNADPCGFGYNAGGCKIVDMEELVAQYLFDCNDLSFPFGTICGQVNGFTSPYSCFDRNTEEAMRGNLAAFAQLVEDAKNAPSEAYNEFSFSWEGLTGVVTQVYDSASSALQGYVNSVTFPPPCTDENGDQSVGYCALHL